MRIDLQNCVAEPFGNKARCGGFVAFAKERNRRTSERLCMNPPNLAIFLSYASQDSDAARRICDALRAVGLEVWFDQSELHGGDAWDASIRKQIKECALFVPVISANTQAREEGYFRLEWKLAVDRSHLMADNKAFFFPVVIGEVPETAASVPDKFRERQWSRLRDASAFAQFAERIAKLLAGSGSPATNAPNAAPVLVSSSTPSAATAKAQDIPSIAVLPFVNLSSDEENEYFADGLAEELLNVIAKIRGLRVAARTSAFSFKGTNADIATIAARLNVANILEGSVRKAGKRIRVTAQLINAGDGYHLWSETYDRELDDIFAVQDDIARAVVKELQATLLGAVSASMVAAEVKAANKGRTDNAEAHRLWLQGRHLFMRSTTRDCETAIAYYRKALVIDPAFAVAWGDLAHALYWHTSSSGSGAAHTVDSYMTGFIEAKAAADRALALEPDLPEALVPMAYLLGSTAWDMAGGERTIRKALALAPGDAEVAHAGAILLMVGGNFDEALGLARRVGELDPLNDSGSVMEARAHLFAGRYAEAEACCRKAIEMNPHGRWRHGMLIYSLLVQERLDEAARAVEASPEEAERRLLNLLFLHWSQGRREESDRLLAEIKEKYADIYAYQLAQAHAWRGEIDEAFAWLETCYQQHDPGVHWAKVDIVFQPLHSDPRWPGLLKKLGFHD